MDIKNSSKGYLRDVVTSTKNFLMHLSVERTIKRQEINCNSLWSCCHVRLEKAPHHAGQPAEKRNICRSTLVGLALLLFFIGLSVFSLLGRQSFASAAGAHSSSVTLHHAASKFLVPTPTGCADPNNIETNQCFGGGNPATLDKQSELVLGSSSCSSLTTVNNGSICWNSNDFIWGTRDNTCLADPKANDKLKSFYKDYPGADFNFAPANPDNPSSANPPPASSTPTTSNFASSTPTTSNSANPSNTTPVHPVSQPLAQGYNQDSCVDGSTCYSNNASNNDFNPVDDKGTLQIHAQVGGDDITCYNNACIPGYTGNKGNTGSGDVCKSGIPYDKFGCASILIDGSPSQWYYNPTAYDPTLMLEQVSPHFRTFTPFEVKGSGNSPVCNDQSHWTCSNNEAVTIILPQGLVTAGNFRVDQEVGSFQNYPPVFAITCGGQNGLTFPCSDDSNGKINIGMIQKDWLSGNVGIAQGSGHLAGIFLSDTLDKPELSTLFSSMLGIGYILIAPFIILMGYQVLYASWIFRHTILLEALPRLLLSIVAISVSYQLARMFLDAANFLNIAIINLHATSAMKYPEVVMGTHHYTYSLEGDSDPASFRGVVVPISRWGCTLNDFMGILGQKLLTDLAGYLPFVGGLVKFAKGIADMVQLCRHIGEFAMLILSINLCAQIIMRIVLINYYILTGPIVFACWALPGGVGQKVLGQWTKGFLSLLLSQTAQIFVLASLPLLLPVLPNFPQDQFGVINILFKQLGPIITLLATIQVPKMMGTGATTAIAQAGMVASGAVAAAGATAYSVV